MKLRQARVRVCIGACVPALWLAACALPAPGAPDPARAMQAWQARTLDDPGLQRFMRAARAPSPAVRPWDFEDLTLAALYFHPDLPLARSELAIAQAQAVTARDRPNPALSAVIGRGAGGEVPMSPWIIGTAIDFLVQLGDRHARRVEQADAQVRAARADLRQAGWRIRARLRAAWLDRWSAQGRLALLREQLDLQTQRVDLFARRVEAGENPAADLRRERTQRAQLMLDLAQSEAQRTRALADLAEAVGVPGAALEAVALADEPLDQAPRLEAQWLSDAARGRALVERADVRDALARLDAAQAELQAQLAQRWPELHLGPAYLFDQGTNKYEVAAMLQWPTSLRGAAAEARGRRDLACHRLLALQAAIAAQFERAAGEWRRAAEGGLAAAALLGEAQVRAAAAQRQFEAGAIDRPSWLAARFDELEARRILLQAHERQQRALAALEDALQQPVQPGAQAPLAPEADPSAPAGVAS